MRKVTFVIIFLLLPVVIFADDPAKKDLDEMLDEELGITWDEPPPPSSDYPEGWGPLENEPPPPPKLSDINIIEVDPEEFGFHKPNIPEQEHYSTSFTERLIIIAISLCIGGFVLVLTIILVKLIKKWRDKEKTNIDIGIMRLTVALSIIMPFIGFIIFVNFKKRNPDYDTAFIAASIFLVIPWILRLLGNFVYRGFSKNRK